MQWQYWINDAADWLVISHGYDFEGQHTYMSNSVWIYDAPVINSGKCSEFFFFFFFVGGALSYNDVWSANQLKRIEIVIHQGGWLYSEYCTWDGHKSLRYLHTGMVLGDKYTEVYTEWPPCYWRYFEIQLHDWILLFILIQIWFGIILED